MHVRIVNMKDPDQTASSALFVKDLFLAKLMFEILEHLLYVYAATSLY